MKRLRRLALLPLTPLAVAASLAAIMHCASKDDESVTIVTACDVAALDTSPAEITVKLWAETATELRTRTQALETRFKDVCNAMNREMGEAEGADARAACNKIAGRIEAASTTPPIPDAGGVRPVWVVTRWDDTCKYDSTLEAKCVDSCSGEAAPCDPIGKCAPTNAYSGTCGGECTGTCAESGENVACKGECTGTCAMPVPGDGGAGQAPTFACGAECSGTCTAATWTGNCTTACDTGFFGRCGGTCTGTCDGTPINTQPPPEDAGAEAGPSDAGPPKAPTGSDANCKGVCRGQCSAQASGSCTSRCNGVFSGGTCQAAGACRGECKGQTGCLTTCTGTCTTRSAQCGGTCEGDCSTAKSAGRCKGTLDCAGNRECKAICGVKAALAATCGKPADSEVRIAGDFALYQAVEKHIADFAALTNEMNLVRLAVERAADRTPGSFKSIGIVRDNAFKCVEGTLPVIAEARTSLNTSLLASQVIKGVKF
jgi:hypothetical protein